MSKKIYSFLIFLSLAGLGYAGLVYNPMIHSNMDMIQTIEEEDGAPTVPVATIIKVPNSTLTDNADGTASLSFGVITEVDPVASAVNGILKSNGTTLSAAIADTDYDSSITNEFNTIQGDDNTATTGLAISIDGAGIVTTDVVGDILTITGTICPATMVDTDGNVYDVVKIGNQCWMAENLNVGTRIDGVDEMADTGTIEKYCYGDDEANCTTYGGLYQWDEMMQYTETEGTQGICSIGWHLPTDAEWYILENYLATGTCDADRSGDWDCAPAGTALKELGSSDFEALLSGYRSTGTSFVYLGSYAFFWSSSIFGGNAWRRFLGSGFATVYRGASSQAFGFSVRCLKDTDDSTLWLFDSLANIGDTNVIADSDKDSDGDILFRTGNEVKMVVENDGNVGIGTVSPTSILDIDKGTGYGQITVNGSSGGCMMFRDTDDAGWTECSYLNGTQTCTLDADGVCDGS